MVAAVLLGGCGGNGPSLVHRPAALQIEPDPAFADLPAAEPFSHADLQWVLKHFVREDKDAPDLTRVEYASLKWADLPLRRYLAAAAKAAPADGVDDAHFPDANCRLAYWINVYNAAVLEAVCRFYPLKRLDELDGFFTGVTFTIGGRRMTLDGIEAELRRQFPYEWKAGFALCRGTLGSPPLRQGVYDPDVLAEQLDEQFRQFLKTDNAILADAEHRVLRLSPVFETCFAPMAAEVRRALKIEQPTVRDVLRMHADPVEAHRISLGDGYRVRYAMDMQLNDRDYEKIDWSFRDGRDGR
jgi:hypothetical protein